MKKILSLFFLCLSLSTYAGEIVYINVDGEDVDGWYEWPIFLTKGTHTIYFWSDQDTKGDCYTYKDLCTRDNPWKVDERWWGTIDELGSYGQMIADIDGYYEIYTYYGDDLGVVIYPELSGSCGENLTWSFDTITNTLSIVGYGEMTSHPWENISPTLIKNISLPQGITSICNSAFYNCSSLTSINIPNSVTNIGTLTFSGCSSLKSIIIPDNVTTIGDGLFCGCSSLESVVFSKNIQYIPSSHTDNFETYGFFESCNSLREITMMAQSPVTVHDGAFADIPHDIAVYVPCGMVSSYERADGWNYFTNIQEPLAEHTINLIFDENKGHATVDKNNYCGNQISATANYGYHFTQWSDGNTENPRSLVLTQDTTLTAEFAPNNYTISTQCNDSERGTTSGDVTTTYLDNITISATANYGYHFSCWNDYNYDNPRQVQVTEDKSYTAYFDKNTYYIIKNYNSNQGYISGVSSAEYLDEVIFTAEANYGYHFTQWSDGNTTNPRTLVLIQDTTLTAEFAPNNYTISTQCNDSERGTTSGDVTTTYLDNITISATANYGYHFSRWNDYNYDNPRQVQVTEDKTYTAYFNKNTYYITKNYDSNQGYVDGYSSGEYLDNITLTAEPNYGYHFVQWSDGNTDNPRLFVLTQDTTFTAEFAQTFSGKCGNNLYWSFNDKTLTITGFGAMWNERPWGLFVNEIQNVVLPSGLTHIGDDAFANCVGLSRLDIPYSITSIGENSFAGCRKLFDIYCYALTPPVAETTSFANYNVYLNVPCDNLRDYQMDMVFGSFKYIQCVGSEQVEEEPDSVIIQPSTNDVTITWPTEDAADTYVIVIQQGDKVFCTLTFNKDGQLLNIAFAPGRDGQNRVQYAEMTAKGLRFTVTNLNSGTLYSYDVTAKNKNNEVLNSYSGEFTTESTTSVEDVVTNNKCIQKLFRNGQLIILRDGVEYNAMGQEL